MRKQAAKTSNKNKCLWAALPQRRTHLLTRREEEPLEVDNVAVADHAHNLKLAILQEAKGVSMRV